MYFNFCNQFRNVFWGCFSQSLSCSAYMFVCAWHTAQISFPIFFIMHTFHWLETEPDSPLQCSCTTLRSGFGVSIATHKRITLLWLGWKGYPRDLLLRFGLEERTNVGGRGSSRARRGPACCKFAVESAKHRNYLKTTFIQSQFPPVLCFILEGDSKSVSLCVLFSNSESVKIK